MAGLGHGGPSDLVPCLPHCVAILAIESFPQTLHPSLQKRRRFGLIADIPAFPSPQVVLPSPHVPNENTGNIPNEKLRHLRS